MTVSKFTFISVAFMVSELFSAIKRTFESMDNAFFVEMISCATAISLIMESLLNMNFIISP
jgi:hypothetical protein